ncbi:hypothetical protein HMPREF0083_02447 [Aneurinibacillus aneurinilyticus ATCC 12856]|uniref:Uncharacterized protein n=1 Tax=Aneurinibacillus aneurinilyticus ATCC 12856 TaxID=649747 RepID=U1X4J7_ANEAE|nr:hypothetical protein HMPREF0083_02447 [Aneurinibacillus aneurinilyticus ATCC 12856]
MLAIKGVDCSERKRPPPFVSLSKRLPQPGERGRQLSPSSRLPRCFAVPPG